MNNIEFIVLSCDLYINNRVESIRNTWGKNNNVKYLTDTIKGDDLISFDTPQNYSGIYLKYLNFFKTYNFTKYDYYFFTDDDTFVNLKNLNKLELPSKNDLFLMGRLLCLNPDGTDLWGNQTGANLQLITGDNTELPLHYTSGGSGFILSQSSCLKIQEYLKSMINPPKCMYGDVSIGYWARNCGVKLIPNNNFWWDTHEKLLNNVWENYNTDIDSITYHYVNNNTMIEYHNKYNL